jgi:hypothetical protein
MTGRPRLLVSPPPPRSFVKPSKGTPKSGPERCHELQGDLAGTFSIDVKQPYRLLFVPIEEKAPPDRSDEQARWASINAIEILTIEDTHG